MIKKINILVLLLLILLSLAAVSASEDTNSTIGSDNSISEVVSVSDENVLASASHTITSDNYGKYFDSNGNLVASNVNPGDSIYLDGSLSNLNFNINKKVNITGTSTNEMKNTMITLSGDASGSSISNLNIANTKSKTCGVFLNGVTDCTVKDCKIVNTGEASYCICLANNANYNDVIGNDLKCYGVTYGHGTRSTPPLLLTGSHNNYVANNHVESDDANGIYLSSYGTSPFGGNSNFNTIYNNTVHYNVLPTSWSYGLQIMGNNNTIKANKVYKAYRGISTVGSGNIITDNDIIDLTGADYNHIGVETGGEFGIVASYDSYVANNRIINAKVIATGAGISAIDNSVVENNWLNITEKGRGIVASGYNVTIRDNVIFTQSGSGIYEKDEGSGLLIKNNTINSTSGVGILIEKLSSKRMPSNVTVVENDVYTGNKIAIDASGVQADSSEIDLVSNNVYGKGIITPSGVIDTSKPTYIFTGNTHTITPSNIRDYINDNGGLTSEIKDGDILNFEGVFNNEIIYVTKGVKITGKNPIFYNTTFKVTSGNVLIENLNIINSEAERVNAWGIFVNQAPGVRITNNTISVNDPKAAYAIYVLESSDIDVINNRLTSQGKYLTFTLLSYACEGCNFANNTICTIGTDEAYTFEPEKCIDGNELVIDGRSYCLDGNEVVIDGKSYCLDGEELVIDGTRYCLDGNEVVIDGTRYCLDGNEVVIDGTRYCLDGNEVVIDGKAYCLDGNELVIDGKSYCIDGNELVIDGKRYCLDGNEYCMDGSHVISEIYRTYGILLLYSSNNKISGNDVNVTSRLQKQYPTTGDASSTNSLVGIDLYYNSHNNTFADNNVFVSGKDNYIYGMGVLGYYTGHNAPEGQGATNNIFTGNNITLEGTYCAEGIIIGDESKDTVIENNMINIKSEVAYGVYLELSQKSTLIGNDINLNAQAIYAIQGYNSNDNVVSQNIVDATGKEVYGILFANGNNNRITENKINAKGSGESLTVRNLDSIASGNAGLYLKSNSTNNCIENNEITSKVGYAVLLDDEAIDNVVVNNLLDSQKGIGNGAVSNLKNNNVSDNYKYYIVAKVNPVTVKYMGTGELTLTFEGDLDGAVVKFYDSDKVLFNQATVKNGIASATYEFDKNYIPAQYMFSAVVTKENYKTSNVNIKIVITKGDLIIALDNISAMQGDVAKFNAKVTDEYGNPIEGAVVDVERVTSVGRLNPMISAKTDKNGIASFEYTIPLSLDAGSYNIVAGVKSLENYNDANSSATLTVSQKPLIINNKDYSVYYGNTIKYKVCIVDVNGKSVGAGKSVTFHINGQTKTAQTDKNGYATCSVKLKAGKYTITAEYEGYKVSNKLTFKPTLIAKDISKKKAKTIKFTVKVVNKKGKILKNKKVTFKVKNKKYTAKTNKKGIATLSLKNLKVGKYTVKSSYGGCTISNKITIKK